MRKEYWLAPDHMCQMGEIARVYSAEEAAQWPGHGIEHLIEYSAYQKAIDALKNAKDLADDGLSLMIMDALRELGES